MTLRDLDKARSFGHDPTTLVELAIASGWTGCVFADKHFVTAVTGTVTTPPHNGQNRPFISKQEHIAVRNEAVLNEWLNSYGQQNVIEGECHEIH